MKKPSRIDDLENFIIANGYHVTKLEAAQLYVFNLPERIKDLCRRRGYERLENHWIHRKGKSDVAISGLKVCSLSLFI